MRQNGKNASPMSNKARNTYVVEHLTESLLELLADKPISAISISELVDKAGVGRASFYRNFECKEDILKRLLNIKMHEWGDEWNKNNNAPLSKQLYIMISHFENNHAFYKLLNDRDLTYLLKDAILSICGPKPEYDKTSAYTAAFAAYALYGWIDTWFQRGMIETADEIMEIFQLAGL